MEIFAYLAVNKDGTEIIFEYPPHRSGCQKYCEYLKDIEPSNDIWYPSIDGEDDKGKPYYTKAIDLPKGSIKKLIGRDLTFDDEPVEIGTFGDKPVIFKKL